MCLSAALAEPPVQYKGWVYYETSDPSPHYQIVDNEKALDEFRQRIPKKRPTKKHPAPPNEDPLLQEGALDFQKNLLIVVMRDETISAYPEFKSVQEDEHQVVVHFHLPEPPPEARPFGWGTYRAVVLPIQKKPYQVKLD